MPPLLLLVSLKTMPKLEHDVNLLHTRQRIHIVSCGGAPNSKINKIVFCDGCDMGYHQKCVVPNLIEIPTGDWYCFDECKCMCLLRNG